MSTVRRNHYDVTNRVRISHPQAVHKAVCALFAARWPQADLSPLRPAFDTFTRLYAGTLPGYVGCETWYHDAQHSLDCALATARLIDGHEASEPAARQLGAKRAVLGVIIALFHDAGYIRRHDDDAHHGAEFTLNHVHRSGEFLAAFLPTAGLAQSVALTRQIVHFTGYEIALDAIRVKDARDRMLGFLLGTADVLAQTADRCYLEKCRDFLYPEFELCGLAGPPRVGGPRPIYRSRRHLLENTPDFNRKLWAERLDGYFKGCHRYMRAHFGGRDPYSESIEAHLARIARLIRTRKLDELRQRPRAVGAQQMKRLLKRAA